jgi:dTDP-4-dehydrorhamnose 3,5-epimerase
LKITDLALPDVKLIALQVHGDQRGSFTETYREADWRPILGETRFVQDNLSRSAPAGTLRGLHYQMPPFAQAKLVQVLAGRILDVAVDIRRNSPTFGQHITVEMAAEDGLQIYVPTGFAHGFLTLSPDCIVSYKVTAGHDPASERGIAWNDPDLGIVWPQIGPLTQSARDQKWPRLQDQPDLF